MRNIAHIARQAIAVVVLHASVWSAAQGQNLTLHIAPNGNDAWSGRLAEPKGGDGPFLTLQRARDEIRKVKKENGLPSGGIVMELRGGVYALAAPLELSAEDSGAEGSPVIWQARPGEDVRIVGGVPIASFQPVTDPAVLNRIDKSAHGKVVQANLGALGIKDFGQVVGDNRLELFFQDKPMTLARWPNEGFVRVVDLVGGSPTQVDRFFGDKIGRFTYEGDRPNRWIGEKDGWLHGYWFFDWSDQRQQIESIDTVKRVIALKPPYHGYGYRKGQWYYAFNLLSEIDSPSEWYLDRSAGILYFWPPASLDQGKPVISMLPAIIRLENISHVALRGLTFEACRGTAIQADGVNDIRIVGCTIRNTGGWAVSLSGMKSGVAGCNVYGAGNGGIQLNGGDRGTLTPAGLWADNNHIHDYSRWNRVYQPGIALRGVGNHATHNLIHDAPHQAIAFSGNEHRIEFNEIHHVCYESNDAGAVYAGRDWTMRGNVIRYNYFHDLIGHGGGACQGVYLDDQFSGAEVFGNLFYRVKIPVAINGGRDCTVANNIFVDSLYALSIVVCEYAVFDQMKNSLEAVPYQDPVWAAKYPKLVNILKEDPMAPKGNLIARNICVRGTWLSTTDKAKPLIALQDNLVDQDPQFVDPEHKNFQLRESSPAYKLGFQRIPLEKIGLYQDPQRASWPGATPTPATNLR